MDGYFYGRRLIYHFYDIKSGQALYYKLFDYFDHAPVLRFLLFKVICHLCSLIVGVPTPGLYWPLLIFLPSPIQDHTKKAPSGANKSIGALNALFTVRRVNSFKPLTQSLGL
jgi:hypothetical protein